jgi:hypothetical protein
MVLAVRIITEVNMKRKSDITEGSVIERMALGFSDFKLIRKPTD